MKNAIKCTFIILLFSSITSCGGDKLGEIPIEKLHYSTTDDTEIFFKNLRKPSYQIEEMKGAGIDIYRTIDDELDTVSIAPYLVLNWRTDQAYILLDSYQELDETKIMMLGKSNQERTFSLVTPKEQTQFSIEIYNAILRGDSISIYNSNNVYTPFFKKTDQREQFRITCYDFLRLVGLQ